MPKEAIGAILAVLSLLGIGLLLASCAWLAYWMLEPINRVAGELKGTTRFLLTDVIGLMILLQIGLAITGRALDTPEVRGEELAMYWLLVGLMALLVVVLWAASVSVVSRAGITRPARRIAVMVLCVPGTLAVMVSLPTLLAVLIVGIATVLLRDEFIPYPLPMLLLLAVGCVGLTAAAFLLRRLSFWSLVGSPGGETLIALRQQMVPAPPLPLGPPDKPIC